VTSAVLEEALKKAALAWVSVGDGPALGLWCMPLDGSLIFITGPGEQFAPGRADATRATARLRGDTGGLIVVAEMAAARILPGSDDWETSPGGLVRAKPATNQPGGLAPSRRGWFKSCGAGFAWSRLTARLFHSERLRI